MSEPERTIPIKLHMTCVSCEGRRNFEPSEKYPTEPGATYQCVKCGHEAFLSLDP